MTMGQARVVAGAGDGKQPPRGQSSKGEARGHTDASDAECRHSALSHAHPARLRSDRRLPLSLPPPRTVGESDDESGELSHWFSHTNGNPMSGTIAFYQLGTKNISHS